MLTCRCWGSSQTHQLQSQMGALESECPLGGGEAVPLEMGERLSVHRKAGPLPWEERLRGEELALHPAHPSLYGNAALLVSNWFTETPKPARE